MTANGKRWKHDPYPRSVRRRQILVGVVVGCFTRYDKSDVKFKKIKFKWKKKPIFAHITGHHRNNTFKMSICTTFEMRIQQLQKFLNPTNSLDSSLELLKGFVRLLASLKYLFCKLVCLLLEFGSVLWDPETAWASATMERI